MGHGSENDSLNGRLNNIGTESDQQQPFDPRVHDSFAAAFLQQPAPRHLLGFRILVDGFLVEANCTIIFALSYCTPPQTLLVITTQLS